MSFEEDIQLKDLVSQALETNGSLAKIRAQLRSSIFCALSEDEKISGLQPLMNNKVKSSLETEEGKLMFSVVRDFLEFFNLDCTLSVYESESYLGNQYQYEGKNSVVEKLGMDTVDTDSHFPILLMLIQFAQVMKNKSNHQGKDSCSREIKSNELNDVQNSSQNLNTTYVLNNPNVCTSNNEGEPNTTPSELNSSENTQSQNSSDSENKFHSSEVAAQPVLKDSRNNDKPKLDKIKSKCTSDASFQNNKSRVSDILPSLYNKEYKDKSGLRESDKMFDMEIEYDEDFMHSRDLSLPCDYLGNRSKDISNNCQKNEIEILPRKDNSNESTNQKDRSNNV